MDSIESLLARAHKVVVDQKAGGGSGGGNMFYLPLDKLLDKGATRDVEPASDATTNGNKEQETVTVEARGRGER